MKQQSAVPTGILKLKSLREDVGSLDGFSRLPIRLPTILLAMLIFCIGWILMPLKMKLFHFSTTPTTRPGPSYTSSNVNSLQISWCDFLCVFTFCSFWSNISASAHYIFKRFLWNCSVPVNTSRFGCMHFHLCKVLIHGQSIN